MHNNSVNRAKRSQRRQLRLCKNHWKTRRLLGNVERESKVSASIFRIQFGVVERFRVEMMNESTERHAVRPAGREVGNVDVLARIKQDIHRVSKNAPRLACYNFDTHEWILILFGRNVTDKVGNQNTLYYSTSNNLYFCTTWQNGETRKSHFSLDCVTRTMHLYAVFLREKSCHLWCVW